ncbi:hypothetical protein A3D05_06395 [Candidatus Gottesmanbacteria bacterium RIFCSPHIGHO2_02_FULL_40_24]|uniref:ATP-grasp domain-containing protein n=1 Tax=Candidatus Gottesmanbacteria bacterium RIFCSPHIGHO2_01_FULL_40_15 TaxID=1798376 RepID=A0A1F5Z043_9BACT|nr:MAG: hypothetical protein A2777_05040 [Candidatus Gottesmanbacteria bacterium RIFCSPHIGHO2_01_FULL_40_15]OGG18520.1 MAG: hypothetical protein A3D05_06395 [Candidatus Gottesmanbacteria bacterium RIFCSPHIGHO2_02_FULL_40_24]OGG23072.1 MAG: hypothetical protein A3B48_03835 [Candidatus Gottesmanbacteria bacterium RIFCSPLOWO2_01_FULL_40_10]OGG24875.1 MAG: hypothetical protein A3E42_02115 [Candidatus Gottesmanbacteria bacterium RIFCSPHIGHO2_12_FULL_40_13]OGG33711.1 MAG: hypothetical protein A3I80_0
MPLKIGLTYDLESDYPLNPASAPDANSEFDSSRTIRSVKEGIYENGYELVDIGNFENLLNIRKTLRSKADLVFNIAEGIKGRNREAQVPQLLEYLNIPYVGSDALTMSLTLDKIITKQILISYKIPTPNYFSYQESGFKNINLKFPLIVKPRWEGSSMAITSESVVKTKQNLIGRVNYIKEKYRQPALVEEFINGSEFTVSVIGNSPPQALIPMKVILNGNEMRDKIFDNSYIRTENIAYIPIAGNNILEAKLRDLAIKTYDAVGCLDFARVDFRVNKQGGIFVLEINPLPALNKKDALAVSAKYTGWSFSLLLEKIIKAALNRYRNN